MRGIFLLVIAVVVLVAAGVISISWNNGTATIKFNKDKAQQRAQQVLDETKALEAQLEQNLQQGQSKVR
jgi:flagellar basal body-associated protein FliL